MRKSHKETQQFRVDGELKEQRWKKWSAVREKEEQRRQRKEETGRNRGTAE